MTSSRMLECCIASIFMGAATMPSAYAQSEGTPRPSPQATSASNSPVETGRLEEIVVTAERREAGLQSVPISVTALTAENLEAKQILDVMSLNKVVPSFAAKPTLSPLEMSVAIRGVTQLLPSVAVDPAIGTYVDGVYNVLNAGSNNALIDMERVEVLKGPQGTLFGRNTIGGAISITTAQPTEDFQGYVEASGGNFDARTVTGVVSGPLVSDALSGRLVYQHTEHDGYGKNFTTGDGTNTLDQDYVRGSIKFAPAEGWDILASGFYTEADGTTAATKVGYFDPNVDLSPLIGAPPGTLPPTNLLIPALSGTPEQIINNFIALQSGTPNDAMTNYIGRGGLYDTSSGISGYQLKQYGGTATVTGELSDAVTVKAITGYSKTDYNTASDLDGTPYAMLDLLTYPLHARQFSEELQVYGDAMDDRLKWIGGLYYFEEKGSLISHVVALGPLRNLALLAGQQPPPGTHNQTGPFVENTSYSAFAQLTYEIVPNVNLTAGARYVTDERDVTYRDHVALGDRASGDEVPNDVFIACSLANEPGSADPAACVFRDSVKYHYVPWTAGVDWQATDDALLYAKVSKGFRSGAYPGTGPAAAQGGTPEEQAIINAAALENFEPADPEELISYEVGSKLEFLDNRLRVNAAAYWSEYDNIQLSVNRAIAGCATCTPISSLENSGTAEIYGGELEVTALIQELELDAAVGYTHPKYVEGPFVGTDIINVSELNYALGASYPIETAVGTLTFNSTYSYRSEATFYTISSGIPDEAADTLKQEGYGTWDARLSFQLTDIPLTISLFGANLTDEEYVTSSTNFEPPLTFTNRWPGTPRTYGATARYSF